MSNIKSRSPRAELLEARAREMRRGLTPSETRLWQAIRGGRLGVAFRRQVVIGRFIVDFLAPKERLVVEVDGGYHKDRKRADRRRDVQLERAGYRVLRVEAELVVRELGSVLEAVRAALR